jgi:hypothetical protein
MSLAGWSLREVYSRTAIWDDRPEGPIGGSAMDGVIVIESSMDGGEILAREPNEIGITNQTGNRWPDQIRQFHLS